VSALSTAAAASEEDAASDADLNRVTPVGKTFGPARVQFLSLALTPKSDNGQAKLTLSAGIEADITLGPVTATFDKAGFSLTADFAKPDGNLSLFDLISASAADSDRTGHRCRAVHGAVSRPRPRALAVRRPASEIRASPGSGLGL
jgi:hypothetical protein